MSDEKTNYAGMYDKGADDSAEPKVDVPETAPTAPEVDPETEPATLEPETEPTTSPDEQAKELEQEIEDEAPTIAYCKVDIASLRVRSTPAVADDNVLTMIAKGTELRIVRVVDPEWFEIAFFEPVPGEDNREVTGFVMASLVTEAYDLAPE